MSSPEKIEFKTNEKVGEKNPEEVRGDFEEHERFGAKLKEIFNSQDERIGSFSGLFLKEVEDIKYITKEGKMFSMQKLLPPDWKLISGFELLATSSPSKEIRYDSSSISNKGFFLLLLHEIGHAHFFESLDKNESSDYVKIYRELILKRQHHLLAPGEEELYKNYVIKSERKAWGYALRTFRHLRKQGIDLAPELTSLKEILSVVMACLASYEKDLSLEDREDILQIVSWGEIEKGEKFLKKELRGQ